MRLVIVFGMFGTATYAEPANKYNLMTRFLGLFIRRTQQDSLTALSV